LSHIIISEKINEIINDDDDGNGGGGGNYVVT